MRIALSSLSALLLLAAAPLPKEGEPGYLPSSPDLGKAEAQCSPNEAGPALIITVDGLKDRAGNLKAELYPSNDDDFLADDNLLIMARKGFRRIETPVTGAGPVQMCMRIPGPGPWSLILLHDRDANRKFGLSSDGVGFPNNPSIGILKRPGAADTRIEAGNGITRLSIRMNYRKGLFGFGPLKTAR